MRRLLLSLALPLLVLATSMAQQSANTDIYGLKNILELKLYLKQPDYIDALDSLKQAGEDERLTGDIVVNGKRYKDVGIRYKGNSSYFNVRNTGSSKLPFNIKIDYKDKAQKLPGGFTSLKLSNVFRDPSFIREVLAYEVAGRYMPSPRANFSKVYLNDKYLGLYNCTESIDDEFLMHHYGEKEGALVKCDPDWHGRKFSHCPEGDKASLMYLGEDSLCYKYLYELKEGHWVNLLQFIKVLNQKPQELETMLNVDQALWMLAFSNATVNLDSYIGRLSHNYYLYMDSKGIYHPLVWDMNLAFGGFRYDGLSGALSNEKLKTLSPMLHYKEKNAKRPLVTNLLANELYRNIYIAHYRTIINDYFISGELKKRALAIQAFVDKEVKADTNRLYSYDDFLKNMHSSVSIDNASIIGLLELIEGRTAYLASHPMFQGEQAAIKDVKHQAAGSKVSIQAHAAAADKMWLCYRHGRVGNFQRVSMAQADRAGAEMPTDGTWLAEIEAAPYVQYYVIAENNKIVSLSPERAAFEFYEIKAPEKKK